ncbi:hypothetical protein Ade02nite_90360 [Paractinoplanes deccanensis]|uniref:Uncharacterized protein n=1 Tax=Paractinoplanes deccanensis TaxID=113561 RepID=A0ABQ3YKE1_9ACTN|nr:TIM-barrel domain-containing protein [Actinoplanes deccanensis]GID80395.1 hypothetical protein Ade02nite_90360 [Actinoplanes deccanensis]
MRRQIAVGLHLGIAGIPWFTTDIGGFAGGDVDDPAFVELLIRWFQFGAFTPVMRLHGDRMPAEPVHAADGSPRLPTGAPYVRELMRDAHRNGRPVMRALFHEFPADETAWSVSDAYMFGPVLLRDDRQAHLFGRVT